MKLGGCSLTDNSIKSRQRQWPMELQLLTVQKCLPSAISDVSPNEELREHSRAVRAVALFDRPNLFCRQHYGKAKGKGLSISSLDRPAGSKLESDAVNWPAPSAKPRLKSKGLLIFQLSLAVASNSQKIQIN